MGAEHIHESCASSECCGVFVCYISPVCLEICSTPIAGKYYMIHSMYIPNFHSESLTLPWPSSLVHVYPLCYW